MCVSFCDNSQFRIQSLEKAEVGEEQVAGSSTVHRQEVRALAKTGSSNRLELPSQGSSQDLLHKEAALSYRYFVMMYVKGEDCESVIDMMALCF